MTSETVGELASKGALPPRDFSVDPGRVNEIASIGLEVPKLSEAISGIASTGNYDNLVLEEAVVGLVSGNLILSGPPGTGKTTLSTALAKAFNASLIVETANPEWSVYDTIGTQTLGDGGAAEPRHGLVTNSILECATAMIDNFDSGEGPQAVWLLIDEMNRADIDRAFGPLFTALAGGNDASMVLDHMPERPVLHVPSRFRIIATINEYDTRFVNSMSGALRRRFSKVTILPPANEPDNASNKAEWLVATKSALGRAEKLTGSTPTNEAIKQIDLAEAEVRRLFGYLRSHEKVKIPVGTAQLIDLLCYLLVLVNLAPSTAEGSATLDRALTARLLPSLETDTSRMRMDEDYLSDLRKDFSQFPQFVDRLEAFVSGRD